MENFFESLREYAVEAIGENREKILEKMKSLTSEQQKSYQTAKICYICKEKFKYKHAKNKKIL